MRRSNAESSDTFTAKQVFFDRTLALHTELLRVSCRLQAKALIQSGKGATRGFRSSCRLSGQNALSGITSDRRQLRTMRKC
jgi:hypothetical protein